MAALDAKVNFDDNAVETKPEIAKLRNDEEYFPPTRSKPGRRN